jgi:hypothetical protein
LMTANYLRGQESASIEIPTFRPKLHSIKVSLNVNIMKQDLPNKKQC